MVGEFDALDEAVGDECEPESPKLLAMYVEDDEEDF
jgi:hypothetical protein